MKSSENSFTLILILGALSTISPFSVDMYLPAFPSIAKSLDTTISEVQLSLTSYLIGIAIGQLFYGPLLDRYGRKKPLYAGMLIYIVASLGCAMVDSVESLIWMRFVQAIGGCAGMVAAQALVRDLFPVNKIAQAFALLTLVIAVSPMIAPTIGGYLATKMDWHYLFIVLAAITALILVLSLIYLPDGASPDRQISLKPIQVVHKYIFVLKNKQFLTYILVGGIAGAAPFAYIGGSSDVFINLYGLTETEYGWVFAFLATAMIGSTQLNHVLLRRFRNQQIVITALSYQLVVGAFIFLGIYLDWFNVQVFIVSLFVFLTGHGLSIPNAAALSLSPFSQNAGSASAMMGFMRMAMGGLVTGLVSLFHNGTAIPMVLMMFLCILLGLLVLAVYYSDKLFKHKTPIRLKTTA
ncbi:MAG: multidrug effflux MFS transporter [Lunatimonas sp.]|uniref:multidrug effflux MFS transporter n=1 Tax=Lunatimonas sp. TaxID=2060141 RepID=UPI00263AD6D9|nr:multidrug effflux MFS transporter [Lunatimonas sp.]MCC5936489.1 multidrug effflux MFS transporter [Lunatimonas sp.]